MKILSLIALACILSINVQAQSKSKKKSSNATALAKIEKDKQARLKSLRLEALESDSINKAFDSTQNAEFELTRKIYADSMDLVIKNTNEANYQSIVAARTNADVAARNQYLIYKGAGLSQNQIQQLVALDAKMTIQADEILQNDALSETDKTTATAQLDADKELKVKKLLGKSDYKKLEKARKKLYAANTNVGAAPSEK